LPLANAFLHAASGLSSIGIMQHRAFPKAAGQSVARQSGQPASNADPTRINYKGKPNCEEREDRKDDGPTGLALFATSVFQSSARASAGQNDSNHAGGASDPTVIPDAIAASRASVGSCLVRDALGTEGPAATKGRNALSIVRRHAAGCRGQSMPRERPPA